MKDLKTWDDNYSLTSCDATTQPGYSKVSIIRPGRSRLLEFKKKDSTGPLIETFSKYPDQVVK